MILLVSRSGPVGLKLPHTPGLKGVYSDTSVLNSELKCPITVAPLIIVYHCSKNDLFPPKCPNMGERAKSAVVIKCCFLGVIFTDTTFTTFKPPFT